MSKYLVECDAPGGVERFDVWACDARDAVLYACRLCSAWSAPDARFRVSLGDGNGEPVYLALVRVGFPLPPRLVVVETGIPW